MYVFQVAQKRRANKGKAAIFTSPDYESELATTKQKKWKGTKKNSEEKRCIKECEKLVIMVRVGFVKNMLLITIN